MIFKRIRLETTLPVYPAEYTVYTYKRIRIETILPIEPRIYKRIRIAATIPVDQRYYRRVRIGYTMPVAEDTSSWTIPTPIMRNMIFGGNGLLLDAALPDTGDIFYIYQPGKGSILNDDLKISVITNTGIELRPGFFYDGNIEYFAFGDDYTYTTFTGNQYTSSLDLHNANLPTVVMTGVPSEQFIQTYNPANSGTTQALRKVVDASEYTESLDGETAYVFNTGTNDFILRHTGTGYQYIFHPDNTGTKYAVTSNSGITVSLPDVLDIPEFVSGFLTITDDDIIIAPDAIKIYVPYRQYTPGDTASIVVTVRGTNGEFAPDYPILVNGTAQTTDTYGVYSGTFTVERPIITVVTNTGVSLPADYSAACGTAKTSIRIEVVGQLCDLVYKKLQ